MEYFAPDSQIKHDSLLFLLILPSLNVLLRVYFHTLLTLLKQTLRVLALKILCKVIHFLIGTAFILQEVTLSMIDRGIIKT